MSPAWSIRRMKPNQKSIEPNRSDCCTIGSVIENIELELFGEFDCRTQSTRLVRFCSAERHDASESEISPSTVYVKQFEINKYLN